METKHTLFKDLQPIDQTTRLTQMVQQAYFRRSRNLPANLGDMVQTLKGDIVKHIPDITVEDLDLAITTSTLNDPENNLSVAFSFSAAKRQCPQRTNTHNWDGFDEDLAYWRDRRTWLENHGQAGTPQHQEACEMERHYQQGDTENDTISLLDTCANMIARMDDAEANGQKVAKVANVNGIRIPLPAFNPKREYFYLVMRKQLDDSAATHFVTQAIKDVNESLIQEGRHRLEKEEADASHDVAAQAMRLAVLDWLRSCNTKNTSPSAILTPLADELSYYQFRRTR